MIAVGLAEVNEFYLKARQWEMDVFCAGDAREIAEASAAMFTGKIEGLKIAQSLGIDTGPIPKEWDEKATILKSKPGREARHEPPAKRGRCFSDISLLPGGTLQSLHLGMPGGRRENRRG